MIHILYIIIVKKVFANYAVMKHIGPTFLKVTGGTTMTREEAINAIKTWNFLDKDKKEVIETLIPELKESKDERIRKALIRYHQSTLNIDGVKGEEILAWLEKQSDKCLVNFNEAEQEKYDFVSGQYIKCRASFNEFKEDNSYWLEYIGNDIYIGRSDNILNQKFHITPRQLYRLFTQQHCPKEDNTNDETNAPTEYGTC